MDELALEAADLRAKDVVDVVDVVDLELGADEVMEARLVAVELAAVELAAGRRGLLSPPVAEPLRVANELEVGVAAVEPAAVEPRAGRRTAVVVAGLLVAVEVLVLDAVVGFLVEDLGFSARALEGEPPAAGASTGDVSVPEASVGASAGASSCWTTSYPSASDIVALGTLN